MATCISPTRQGAGQIAAAPRRGKWHHRRVSSFVGNVRRHWPALLIWSLVCAAMFTYCWMDRDFDDLSGWIVVIFAVQLPVFAVAVQPEEEAPALPPKGWAVASAISLGLVTGFTVFLLTMIVGSWVWHDDFIEMRPIQVGLLAGLVTTIATSVRWSRRLLWDGHPQGLRRALLELLAVALLLVATAVFTACTRLSARCFGAQGMTRATMLFLSLPFLWAAPFGLLLRRDRRDAPRARVVPRGDGPTG